MYAREVARCAEMRLPASASKSLPRTWLMSMLVT